VKTVIEYEDLDHDTRHKLIDVLRRLCKDNPLSAHCYATYYLVYEPDRTSAVLLFSNNESIESYALIWYGGKFSIQDVYEVHVWNPAMDVIQEINIPPEKRADIQLHGTISISIDVITGYFRSLGFRKFHVEEYYDMVCGYKDFKPSPFEKLAVRLGEEHATLYKDLELERGIEIGIDEARSILREYTHYGVIIDDILVAIAARYVTLPEIHVLGGIFTRKEYRRRGYARAVTSALTREAVASRTLAGLHVEVDNEPAINVYRNLGYKIIKTRTWIYAHP